MRADLLHSTASIGHLAQPRRAKFQTCKVAQQFESQTVQTVPCGARGSVECGMSPSGGPLGARNRRLMHKACVPESLNPVCWETIRLCPLLRPSYDALDMTSGPWPGDVFASFQGRLAGRKKPCPGRPDQPRLQRIRRHFRTLAQPYAGTRSVLPPAT